MNPHTTKTAPEFYVFYAGEGAISLAVKRCTDEGLIADFLRKHSRGGMSS